MQLYLHRLRLTETESQPYSIHSCLYHLHMCTILSKAEIELKPWRMKPDLKPVRMKSELKPGRMKYLQMHILLPPLYPPVLKPNFHLKRKAVNKNELDVNQGPLTTEESPFF